MDTRQAKEYLIRCITREAEHQNTPLSETERDMLYFSETAWTLPDMAAVNQAFDRDYDQASYEARISALIREFKKRAAKEDSAALDTWKEAVNTLQTEDHYILVMVGIADGRLSPSGPAMANPSRPMFRLLAIGVGAGFLAILILFLILRLTR